jgi:hypothetical protein
MVLRGAAGGEGATGHAKSKLLDAVGYDFFIPLFVSSAWRSTWNPSSRTLLVSFLLRSRRHLGRHLPAQTIRLYHTAHGPRAYTRVE